MKTTSIALITLAMFLLLLAAPSFAADAVKIGVFDINEVMERSEGGQLAKATLEKEFKEKEAELQKRAKEIEELKKQFEQQRSATESDLAKKKISEIRLKTSDLKNRETEYNRQLNISKDKVLKKLFEEVSAIADEIGKTEGYTMILLKQNRPSPSVWYAAEGVDITDKVIEAYNTQFIKKGKEKNR